MKEKFQELLNECKTLVSTSKFYKEAKVLQHDPRFKNLDEKTREETFQDHIDDIYARERETKKNER